MAILVDGDVDQRAAGGPVDRHAAHRLNRHAVLNEAEIGVDHDVRGVDRHRLVHDHGDRGIVQRKHRMRGRIVHVDRERLIERQRLVIAAGEPVRNRAGRRRRCRHLAGRLQRDRVIDVRRRATGAFDQNLDLQLARRALIENVERPDLRDRLDDLIIQTNGVEHEPHAGETGDGRALPRVLVERGVPLVHAPV